MTDVRVFLALADPDDRRDLRHIVDDATGVQLVGDGVAEPDTLDSISRSTPVSSRNGRTDDVDVAASGRVRAVTRGLAC